MQRIWWGQQGKQVSSSVQTPTHQCGLTNADPGNSETQLKKVLRSFEGPPISRGKGQQWLYICYHYSRPWCGKTSENVSYCPIKDKIMQHRFNSKNRLLHQKGRCVWHSVRWTEQSGSWVSGPTLPSPSCHVTFPGFSCPSTEKRLGWSVLPNYFHKSTEEGNWV